jgi:hypothetical protein
MSIMQCAHQMSADADRPVLDPDDGERADPAAVESADDKRVDEIVGRLQRRYTDKQISAAELESRVRGFYRQFDSASIRSFVAVFVERLVRRSIEEPSLPAPGTSAA